MRIFGLDIVRHSHYEHLMSECSKLAIQNVNLNKYIALLEGDVRMYEAKTELYHCIIREQQDKIERKNAKRDNKGRFIKK